MALSVTDLRGVAAVKRNLPAHFSFGTGASSLPNDALFHLTFFDVVGVVRHACRGKGDGTGEITLDSANRRVRATLSAQETKNLPLGLLEGQLTILGSGGEVLRQYPVPVYVLD